MTIHEAIALLDTLKPNQYGASMKIDWLSVLDSQIYAELYQTHENCSPAAFTGYGEATPTDRELLVPFPYDRELYSFYLQSAVDRENGETAKYNQSVTLFNNAYLRFESWYNRSHLPLHSGAFQV